MKDIMQKLAELEATAPKVTKKKMLNEDSTTPPMNVSNKPASLKDVFAALSENVIPGQKPLPVLDPQKKQAGMGFVTSSNPSVQNILKNLDPKDVQIVQAPGQTPAAGQQPQATAAGQPNPNQLQTGQQAVQEKDEGKPGKNFAKIAKSAGARYGSKEAGERVAGAVRAKLAKQGKLEEVHTGDEAEAKFKKYDKKELDHMLDRAYGKSKPGDAHRQKRAGQAKDAAYNIMWKKKYGDLEEGDIAPTSGIDTKGAGLGAGRSTEFTEGKKGVNPFAKKDDKASTKAPAKGKKPDFLDLDKDGNKKEPMKKAAADKKKKKVDESMNHRISAARFEGKAHGLKGHAHCGKSYEDLGEMKAYHEGYKEGLDECYGQGVYETAPAMPAATVPGMADAAMDEGNAFTRGLANAKKGEKFSVGGKTFTDRTSYDANLDEYAFESGGADGALSSVSIRWVPGDREHNKVLRFRNQIKTFLDSGDIIEKEDDRDTDVYSAYTPEAAKALDQAYYEYGEDTRAYAKGAKEFAAARAKQDAGILGRIKSAVGLGETDYAFESLDKQLNALLNESEEVNEGLSVSISKGQQNSPDSVTITAQDQEAEHLLAFVKNAGLGLFGDDNADTHSSAMSVQPSHGAPDEVGAGGIDIGVVDGHDGMMGLMQKLSGIQAGGAEDYADEEGDEEHLYGNHETADKKDCGCDGDCECSDYDQPSNEGSCKECGGMMEAGHSCNEEQSEDQMGFLATEANAPDSGEAESTADEDAEAEEDAALAKSDMQNKTNTVNEGGDGGEASEEGAESKEGGTDEEGETVSESFANLFRKLAFIAEESTEKEDDKAEKAGKKVAKDIEYDEGHKGKADDKAEKAGKKVTKDIEYDDKKDKKEKVGESLASLLDRLTKLAEGSGDEPKHSEHDKKDDKDQDDAEEEEVTESAEAGSAKNELAKEIYKIADRINQQERSGAVGSIPQMTQKLQQLKSQWKYSEDPEELGLQLWRQYHADKKASAAQPGSTKFSFSPEKSFMGRMADKAKQTFGMKEEEELNEWANNAGPGKTVSDTTFEQDIDFMTKVIAGGLNKPKSTGQTTIPVIAGQDDRTHDNPMDWATLAGIKK
jgi:hypothetical protein